MPFIVIATQNPSDLSGTSLLPESQLDRFMISFSLDELTNEQQLYLLKNENKFEIKKNNQINLEKIVHQKKLILMIMFINIFKKLKKLFKQISQKYIFQVDV